MMKNNTTCVQKLVSYVMLFNEASASTGGPLRHVSAIVFNSALALKNSDFYLFTDPLYVYCHIQYFCMAYCT